MMYLGIEVADVDAEYERLKKHGVQTDQTPADNPWGDRGFMVCDPIGLTLYLSTPIAPGSRGTPDLRAKASVCRSCWNSHGSSITSAARSAAIPMNRSSSERRSPTAGTTTGAAPKSRNSTRAPAPYKSGAPGHSCRRLEARVGR
jgi:hypothetical protein